jgi:uncharacterized membrane protein YjjB (DUF3815 family)
MRKLILGLAFLGCATFIVYAGIQEKSDLVGLATVIGALAGGTFGIVWGNTQEWKAKKGNGDA